MKGLKQKICVGYLTVNLIISSQQKRMCQRNDFWSFVWVAIGLSYYNKIPPYCEYGGTRAGLRWLV